MKDKKTSAPAEMSRERQCSRGNVQYKFQCVIENNFLFSSTVLENKAYRYLHFKWSINVQVMLKCLFFSQEICQALARPQEVTRKITPCYLVLKGICTIEATWA